MDSIAEFSEQVDSWVLERVRGNLALSWSDLVKSLPGVYPAVVMESLERLGLRSFVRFDEVENPRDRLRLWKGGELPTPHPLDFSWWFDRETLELLFRRMKSFAQAGQDVILLGTPLLFKTSLLPDTSQRITLLDRDPTIGFYCNGATARRVDLMRDPLPPISAQLIIADPPWYEEEMRAFLWCARQLSTMGGHVIMSVPPRGARPGVLEQRQRITDWARTLGLTFVRLEPACVGYDSPLFEKNALKASSVPIPSDNWRRGDLLTFRCEKINQAQRPVIERPAKWEEVIVSSVRIRVRIREENTSWNPELKPILHGDILPTVSRRDPVRESIDVWTSGNRVFRCDGAHALLLVLGALREGRDPVALVLSEFRLSRSHEVLIRQAVTRIADLIETEEIELARYSEGT